MVSLVPVMEALYQLFVSVQRRIAPRLALVKLLIEPLKSTSASVAPGPSIALWLPLPLDTCPVLLAMEKTLCLLASPPQVCPSEAVPHRDWLGRWKVSCASVVPGDGEGSGVRVRVGDGDVVTVGVGDGRP